MRVQPTTDQHASQFLLAEVSVKVQRVRFRRPEMKPKPLNQPTVQSTNMLHKKASFRVQGQGRPSNRSGRPSPRLGVGPHRRLIVKYGRPTCDFDGDEDG